MTVAVALENRFYEAPDGNIYSNNIFDYDVWKKYLSVFDEVLICARLGKTNEIPKDKKPATGPNVSLHPLPMYLGPKQFFLKRASVIRALRWAIPKADAFILRSPGTVGNLMYKELRRKNLPYGVEVVGNSYESFKSASTNKVLQWLLNIHTKTFSTQKQQCYHAVAAAYVTENFLQNIFPCPNWSTHYSSINLLDEHYLSPQKLEERKKRIDEIFSKQRVARICHIGTMSAPYKAQDDLIKATAMANFTGMKLELTFIGDGLYRKHFQAIAKDYENYFNIEFLGQLPPGDTIRHELDRTDLFVLPSLTEGLPRVILEAMARGVPCIGSNVGGIPELVCREQLFEPKDVERMSKLIVEILNSRGLYERLHKEALLKAKEYHIDILMKRRREFYTKVAEASSERRRVK